jgi:hypothetical protein
MVMEMTESVWDETFDTDLKCTFFAAKFAAQAMIAARRGGRIINVLSTAAFRVASPLVAYGAARLALDLLLYTGGRREDAVLLGLSELPRTNTDSMFCGIISAIVRSGSIAFGPGLRMPREPTTPKQNGNSRPDEGRRDP